MRRPGLTTHTKFGVTFWLKRPTWRTRLPCVLGSIKRSLPVSAAPNNNPPAPSNPFAWHKLRPAINSHSMFTNSFTPHRHHSSNHPHHRACSCNRYHRPDSQVGDKYLDGPTVIATEIDTSPVPHLFAWILRQSFRVDHSSTAHFLHDLRSFVFTWRGR